MKKGKVRGERGAISKREELGETEGSGNEGKKYQRTNEEGTGRI